MNDIMQLMVETTEQQNSYGKRPLWQWLILYMVVAVVLYGGFYYFFLSKNGGYKYNTPNTYNSVTPTIAKSNVPPSGNIYLTKTDAVKGAYLTDFVGKTLYIYDKDKVGISNCYGGCAVAWPPYISSATVEKTLPANISVITRTDGTKQFAWKGWPLYYYATDQKPGDITGDGVGGVWHIVKP